MIVEMSKEGQERRNASSKRQGVVYNGNEQIDNLVDFPTSFVVDNRFAQGNEKGVSNLLRYDKDEETRKSTGSINNIMPTQDFYHVRSNSDTSQNFLPPSFRINNLPEEPTAERPTSGDNFFALIQRFENASLIEQKLNVLTSSKKAHDQTDSGRKLFKSPLHSGTASPSTDKKSYLNLKRKGSLKANSARKTKSDEKGVIGERDWEKPRKAFAHYDVQSAAFDFESIADNRQRNGDVSRWKNTITGASAASGRETAAVIADKNKANDGESSPEGEKENEEGDYKSNELVESCPFFRNELGGEQDEIFGAFRYNSSYKALNNKTSTEKRHSTLDVVLTAYDSVRRGQIFSATGVTVFDSTSEQEETNDLCSIEDDKKIFEHVDHGAFYYRQDFLDQEHYNYLGEDERFGAVAISYRREKTDVKSIFYNEEDGPLSQYEYHVIVRTSEMETLRGSVLEDCIPSTSRHGTGRGLPPKDILDYVCPEINVSCLRLAIVSPKVPEILLKLDEQGVTRQHKIGILYCKSGQSTEEEMYNNEEAGPAFEEFMELIGERVALKGFEGYRAQLDNRNDSTGVYSLYRKFRGREIMFHVSTMLPWTPNNRQQLLRKRHIGNDIVTIVFQEPGALPFTPKNIRSHFQHVFILVRVFEPCTMNTRYQVSVSRSKDVPAFGPPIPANGVFTNKNEFELFLVTKLINAENAAHKSQKFRAMAVRTRHEYLKDLVSNYVSNSTVETGAKFGMFSLGSKKKEKVHPNINPEILSGGGLCWDVEVEDTRNTTMIACLLILSIESFVLIDKSTREAIFYIPCKAIIGWTPMSKKLKLFHGGGDCLVLHLPCPEDIPSIVRRLERVTIGCQAVSMILRRINSSQLGFNVHNEGMVVEVEPNGLAQLAGLKQHSRLVEIFGNPVATMSYVEMVKELRRPGHVPVVVIPPFPNGRPRKGPHLAAVSYGTPTVAPTTIFKPSTQPYADKQLELFRQGADPIIYTSTTTIDFDTRQDTPNTYIEENNSGTPWVRKQTTIDDENNEEIYDQQEVKPIQQPEFSITASVPSTPYNGVYKQRPVGHSGRKSTNAGQTDNETPEYYIKDFNYIRPPSKTPDKRMAAEVLQNKLAAHARTDSHLRGRQAPFTAPKPERGAAYNNYKLKETPKRGQDLKIIHARSQSEPCDHFDVTQEGGGRRTYKETTLGPRITTVETFRDNHDYAMTNTVDQIKFGSGTRTPPTTDKSPSLQNNHRRPVVPRLQGINDYKSSSNESLTTSEPCSDSERERSGRKPLSSKRLVSKKMAIRAEITSTTAKSPSATTNTRDVMAPSVQSTSTTVFVRSKSNEPSNETTPKRTPRHVDSNTLPRTVNREEVVITRENSGTITPRKRQGLIREFSQGDSVSYLYSPRPFVIPSTPSKSNREAEAFQFPDANGEMKDEKPKVVSQTKICLMSPTGNKTPEKPAQISLPGSPRSVTSPATPKSNKVPYFMKNKREYTGITPELVEQRINKIASKQRSKTSPDILRKTSVPSKTNKDSVQLVKTRAAASDVNVVKNTPDSSGKKEGDDVLNEYKYMLSQTDAMSRDLSQMLESWDEVLSGTNDQKNKSLDLPNNVTRARLPSDGSSISVVLPLKSTTTPASPPRRHSLDDSILSSHSASESLENLSIPKVAMLSSKDGFQRISQLETKVTELSYFLQKEREENIQLKKKLAKIEKNKQSRK